MQRNRLPVTRVRREASSPAEYADPISGPHRPDGDDAWFTALGHRVVTRVCTWGVIMAAVAIIFGF